MLVLQRNNTQKLWTWGVAIEKKVKTKSKWNDSHKTLCAFLCMAVINLLSILTRYTPSNLKVSFIWRWKEIFRRAIEPVVSFCNWWLPKGNKDICKWKYNYFHYVWLKSAVNTYLRVVCWLIRFINNFHTFLPWGTKIWI